MASLRVLVVDDEAPITGAISAVLRRRGHHVTVATSAEEALTLPPPDVLITDLVLTGASGLDLLATLQDRGSHPHTVFVTGQPTVADCRRAMLMGAAEFLTKPFRLDDLVRAVETQRSTRLQRTPTSSSSPARAVFERCYASELRNVERAARDLCAFALRSAIGPSGRARIASACAEIVDNACRHGHAVERGEIAIRAEIDARVMQVEIRDRGLGFDCAILDPRNTPVEFDVGGLSRALALCESMQVESAPGKGTCVRLSFTAHRMDFDEALPIDLTELDFLTPDVTRRVLHALGRHDTAGMYRLSPALAVVVGRLLAGPDRRCEVARS